MARKRRRYGLDEAKIQRFIREKRGLGTGKEYKPFFTVRDVPSTGRSHRPYSQKTRREHHLLSDNEYYAFHRLHWHDEVIDIREQFPLPREQTLRIAAELRVKHPVDPYSRTLWVITTDLLVTKVSSTGTFLEAYSVKEAKALLQERSLEKLEIERQYWERRDVPWYLLTNEQVKNQESLNLKWLYNADISVDNPGYRERDRIIRQHIAGMQVTRPYVALNVACSLLDKRLGIAPGESLASLRRSMFLKLVSVDLKSRSIPDEQLKAFLILE